jgi:hypothetical protein
MLYLLPGLTPLVFLLVTAPGLVILPEPAEPLILRPLAFVLSLELVLGLEPAVKIFEQHPFSEPF